MRQGQHSKRARGRGRKPQNVNRTFESNGPDVKIRGTAATIAEKYLSLARDAQASGDPVASENYLQHAEHYFRIIAAAQAYAQSQHQSEQPSVINGHGNDGADNDREVRSGGSGANGSHGGDHPGQNAQPEQPSVDGGEDAGDGRARRSRGRRSRRPDTDEAPENVADVAAGGEAKGDEPDSSSDTTVVAEAG